MVLQIEGCNIVEITLDVVFLHESCERQQSVTFAVEKAGEFFNADFIPSREKTDNLFTRIN